MHINNRQCFPLVGSQLSLRKDTFMHTINVGYFTSVKHSTQLRCLCCLPFLNYYLLTSHTLNDVGRYEMCVLLQLQPQDLVVDRFAQYLYDSVIIYALALNRTIMKGQNPRSGRDVASNFANLVFKGKASMFSVQTKTTLTIMFISFRNFDWMHRSWNESVKLSKCTENINV